MFSTDEAKHWKEKYLQLNKKYPAGIICRNQQLVVKYRTVGLPDSARGTITVPRLNAQAGEVRLHAQKMGALRINSETPLPTPVPENSRVFSGFWWSCPPPCRKGEKKGKILRDQTEAYKGRCQWQIEFREVREKG